MREIIFLEPVFKEMIWGGCRLRDEFNYNIRSDKTGECWAVSAHDNGDCRIRNGRFKGSTLSQVWKEHRELFGNLLFEKFPLLVKIIDAREDLSLQVHPDDIYAREHENNSLGKTECWYILDCEKEANVIIGHNAKTKEEMYQMIDENRWEEFIRKIPIHKGDVYQINPGTVHGIKGGTLLLEIQQNSDITYRIYDYDRRQDGKLRELHIDKCKEVISVPYTKEYRKMEERTFLQGELLISCPYYTIVKLENKGETNINQIYSFLIVNVISGHGTVDNIPVKKGDNFILTYEYGKVILRGEMSLIFSYIL